jgi:PAS domain S-box-containing protein
MDSTISAKAALEVLQANILMVDDRPANLVALEAALKPLGHTLVSAHSGEEALKQLLETDFAVILMDVQMPGLDGYQTVALIKQREKCRQVPILFISAINKDVEHILKGYSFGAVDYILKPVEPFVLRAKVAAFVDLYLREQQVKRDEATLREAEAQRSEQRFRDLTESMPLCVWAAKPDGQVHYANRAWMEYTGLSREQTSGLGFLAAVRPDHHGKVRDLWMQSIRTGQKLEMEFPLRLIKDGTYHWHLVRAVPERDGQGQAIGWIATATDIDAQKKAQEDRARLLAAEQNAREVAEAASRSKDEFVATVSHELRNPLNAIIGWTRMLRSRVLEPKRFDRALDALERNAQVQAKLVEDLLDISRIIAGKLQLRVRPISLSQVLKAACDTVRPTAEGKGVQLIVSLDSEADEVSADPDRLQQVVWNLLSNAIKFTPAGGKVELRSTPVGSGVEVQVSDTGAGIAPDLLPHVFDRFRQADSSSTRLHGGLGLGLSIVRHIVELHGGVIEAKSPGEGRGATFSVRLPLFAPQLESAESQLPPEGAIQGVPLRRLPSLQGLNVLFVDDQCDARELVTELLEIYGARVVAVDSAESALKEIESAVPDVLVSDIGMPREDGYELIRKLRARENHSGTHLPAIAVTGFASAEDARRALAEGFERHLAKPIDPAELISVVAALAIRPRRASSG